MYSGCVGYLPTWARITVSMVRGATREAETATYTDVSTKPETARCAGNMRTTICFRCDMFYGGGETRTLSDGGDRDGLMECGRGVSSAECTSAATCAPVAQVVVTGSSTIGARA